MAFLGSIVVVDLDRAPQLIATHHTSLQPQQEGVNPFTRTPFTEVGDDDEQPGRSFTGPTSRCSGQHGWRQRT